MSSLLAEGGRDLYSQAGPSPSVAAGIQPAGVTASLGPLGVKTMVSEKPLAAWEGKALCMSGRRGDSGKRKKEAGRGGGRKEGRPSGLSWADRHLQAAASLCREEG